ncbi:MAG: hypothetical protein E6R03_05140 [Hyphomicrobiaceae bacterium]|nr:MAG: hypothetical protein E6R03_05140 [Hyphomicrobiaceae bacterium]
MTPEESFSWDSPESRAYLRALMHEQEALFARITHSGTVFPQTLDPSCTVGELGRISKQSEQIDEVHAEARRATQDALDALVDEMHEWLALPNGFELESWIAKHLKTDDNQSGKGS